jgi:hypothetical protein
MNNRISCLIISTLISGLFLGCSQISSSSLSETSSVTYDNHSAGNEHHQSTDLKWLDYADPKADANLAIEKQNFNLLAFAGRTTSFPGIDGESGVLQQRCGYRLLPNSSDTLRSEKELNIRKDLYQYAATYNQLVLVACQKTSRED